MGQHDRDDAASRQVAHLKGELAKAQAAYDSVRQQLEDANAVIAVLRSELEWKRSELADRQRSTFSFRRLSGS